MEQKSTEAALSSTLQLLSYVIIAIGALFLAIKAGSLPASRWEPMNAGTFPQIVFLSVAVLCGIAVILEVARNGFPRASLNVALTRLNRLKPVIVNIILFTCYMIAMPWLGFITSTFIYLVTAQTFLTTEKLKALPVILCVAVVFSAGPYFMFSELFNIYLPRAQW